MTLRSSLVLECLHSCPWAKALQQISFTATQRLMPKPQLEAVYMMILKCIVNITVHVNLGCFVTLYQGNKTEIDWKL